MRMMVEMSRLADEYGLDVWIWYPALDKDYADPETVEFALKEWGEVFRSPAAAGRRVRPRRRPRAHPAEVLIDLLEKQTANLRHVPPEGGDVGLAAELHRAWMDEFDELVKPEPAWLAGLVHGPQVRVDLPDLRAAAPKRTRFRDYPDITHSRHCQYPVPDWDVAFALTAGPRGVNPRPVDDGASSAPRRTRPASSPTPRGATTT